MNVITINKDIIIPYSEVKFEFFRSSGPGGQHVNKVETGVRLRFNVTRSIHLPEQMKKRLLLKVRLSHGLNQAHYIMRKHYRR